MSAAYSASVSRAQPCLIVLLVDTSSSMADPLADGVTRIDFVRDAINRALAEIITACQRYDGVYDYFHFALLAYNSQTAQPAFGGALAGRDFVTVSELRQHPYRTEKRVRKMPDGAGGLVEAAIEFDIWFDPRPGGGTSMCAALRRTAQLVQQWCARNPKSFPPLVLHLTDGEAMDEAGESTVQSAARAITSIQVEDGHALLLTLHISNLGEAVSYPSDIRTLPDNASARAMFECSSVLPPPLLKRAFLRGLRLQPGARGYIYNGKIEEVVNFLDIGTRAATDLITPNER